MEQKTVKTVSPDNLGSSRPEVFLKTVVLKNSKYISFLGPNFSGMRGLILALMSHMCYLAVILIFLVLLGRYCSLPSGYCSLPVVTARYRWLLLVTGGYCSLLVVIARYRWLLLVTGGYCSLPVVIARYRWLLLVSSGYCSLRFVTARSHF